MLGTADRPVAVVVDLDVAGTPGQRDRRVGCLHEADRGAQALRPGIHGAEWGLGPVLGLDHPGHLAATDEPIFQGSALSIRHVRAPLEREPCWDSRLGFRPSWLPPPPLLHSWRRR